MMVSNEEWYTHNHVFSREDEDDDFIHKLLAISSSTTSQAKDGDATLGIKEGDAKLLKISLEKELDKLESLKSHPLLYAVSV